MLELSEFDKIFKEIFKNENKFAAEIVYLFKRILDKIDYLEKNNLPLLEEDVFIEIKSYFDKVECNYSQMDKYLKIFSKKLLEKYGKKYDINQIEEIIYYNNKISNSSIMNLYFKKIHSYFKQNFTVFGLGDSLYKFDVFWNSMNPDKKIINIPFSGSFFDPPDIFNKNARDPTFNKEKYDKMLENLDGLYIHNKNFKRMIDLLRKDKPVLITDYGNMGGATITVLILLSKIKGIPEKMHNIRLLLLSFNENIFDFISSQITLLDTDKKINLEKILDLPYVDDVFSRYYTNSEDSNSRCIPKYGYKLWDKMPDKMYLDGLNYNYFGCYLATYIHFLYNYCYYNKSILPYINEMDENLYVLCNKQTKEFFSEKYLIEFKEQVAQIIEMLDILEKNILSRQITKDVFIQITQQYLMPLFNIIQKFDGVSSENKQSILKKIEEKMPFLIQTVMSYNPSEESTHESSHKSKKEAEEAEEAEEIEEIEKKYYKYKLKYLQLKKILNSKKF